MAVAHRSVISFGLVAIPVAMYTATQDNDIHFNQLHAEDQGRIKYKRPAPIAGKRFLPVILLKDTNMIKTIMLW